MNNDFKDKIILPSWEITRTDWNLKKYYFIPWILSIIFLSGLLAYQSVYTYVKIIWHNQDKVLKAILRFLETDIWFELLIAWIIILILHFILGPIFEWWLVKYIDFKQNDKILSKSEAFWQWLYKFLPVFEYNNMFSEFKMLSILNFYLFTIRFTGLDYIQFINYVFLFLLFLSLIINVLFVYSKYFLILENKNIFESLWESSKLAMLNLKITFKIYLLLLFLNFRVILNFLTFLAFPIFIALAIGFITSKFLLVISVWILSILFLILILILWYITAVLDIFKTSVWYYAYLNWKKNL